MCHCKDSENREACIYVPTWIELRYNTPEQEKREWVAIDVCLIPEIWDLWKQGIVTTGCCCGHNQRKPYIGVREDFIPRMKELGYKVQPNKFDLSREDSFVPLSVRS